MYTISVLEYYACGYTLQRMGVLGCQAKKPTNWEQQILEDAEILTNLLTKIDPNSSLELFRSVQKLEKKLSSLLNTWGDDDANEGDGSMPEN